MSVAEIWIHSDPLRPNRGERYEVAAGERLIDWLFREYPAGFGAPITIARNGEPVPIAEADFALLAGDYVAILVQPALPAGFGAALLTSLIVSTIMAVVTIVLSMIFKPQGLKSHGNQGPDPIYSITGAQNAARLGEPVPVLYGQVVTVPDFASQPYVFFSANDQFIDQLLVIGQGEYDLLDIMVGETPVSAMQSGAATSWLFPPAAHGQVMGPIEAASAIMENVVTSAEVGEQELPGIDWKATGSSIIIATFTAPNHITFTPPPAVVAAGSFFLIDGSNSNDGVWTVASMTSGSIFTVENTIVSGSSDPCKIAFFVGNNSQLVGPFITSKPGQNGNRIMVDIVWPGGVYQVDKTTGDMKDETVQFRIDYQAMADDGTPIGSAYTSVNYTLTAQTNTPQRKTYAIDVPAGRYRVRLVRTSAPSPNTRHVNSFVWVSLKFRLVTTAGPVYGPVTLLGLRIKATNGVASSASSRIRAKVIRKLAPMGSGTIAQSRSPADAFVDIYTNAIYGAHRPLAEVDLTELARIRDSWGGLAKFDGAFAQKSTIWEALSLSVQTANAAPLPIGHIMSIAQEGVKATRRQFFSDANMSAGSLSVGYSFDKLGDADGVRVEYRDPVTWNSLFALYPTTALEPEAVELFGCSDGTQAAQFARLLWQKRKKLRKTATFETELEGLLARMGDRVAVSAALPRWGMSGVVVGVSGLTLWLDKKPDWSGSGWQIILRSEFGAPSNPIAVTPGPEPTTVILATAAPFPLFGTGMQEPTHYAFGTAVQLVRDFTVQKIEPRGGPLVAVEALAYDPTAFDSTLPWLVTAT